jgi:hypothetical protein
MGIEDVHVRSKDFNILQFFRIKLHIDELRQVLFEEILKIECHGLSF